MAEKPKKKEERAEVEVIEAESDPPVQVKSKIIMKRRERAIIREKCQEKDKTKLVAIKTS